MRAGTRVGSIAAVLLLACSPDGRSAWVAEVDGDRIPVSALEKVLGPRGEEESGEAREKRIIGELDRLIRERLVLNRARELGVTVEDAEVDELLSTLYGEDPVPEDPDFREQVRREIAMDRTAVLELAPRIDVPESAIALALEEDQRGDGPGVKVEVRQIIVSDPAKARRLLRELRGGGEFEAIAREHSLGPEAANGGLLPPFERGELPEAFDVAFKLRPGDVSDVVESPYGFHIFKAERRIEPEPPDPEEARAAVRERLERERFVELRESWIRALRQSAEIRINERALDEFR